MSRAQFSPGIDSNLLHQVVGDGADAAEEWLMGASLHTPLRTSNSVTRFMRKEWPKIRGKLRQRGRAAIAHELAMSAPSHGELVVYWSARNWMSRFGIGAVGARGQEPGLLSAPSRADVESGALAQRLAASGDYPAAGGTRIAVTSKSGRDVQFGSTGVRLADLQDELEQVDQDRVAAQTSLVGGPVGASWLLPALVIALVAFLLFRGG